MLCRHLKLHVVSDVEVGLTLHRITAVSWGNVKWEVGGGVEVEEKTVWIAADTDGVIRGSLIFHQMTRMVSANLKLNAINVAFGENSYWRCVDVDAVIHGSLTLHQ